MARNRSLGRPYTKKDIERILKDFSFWKQRGEDQLAAGTAAPWVQIAAADSAIATPSGLGNGMPQDHPGIAGGYDEADGPNDPNGDRLTWARVGHISEPPARSILVENRAEQFLLAMHQYEALTNARFAERHPGQPKPKPKPKTKVKAKPKPKPEPKRTLKPQLECSHCGLQPAVTKSLCMACYIYEHDTGSKRPIHLAVAAQQRRIKKLLAQKEKQGANG